MDDFEAASTWDHIGGDHWRGEVPESWMQGRAAYGGLIAAIAIRTMRGAVDPERLPRGLTANLVGPVRTGPADLVVQVLRAGRSLTQVQATITQGEALRAVLVGSFGADRPSKVQVLPPPSIPRPDPSQLQAFGFIPGVTPVFTRHFEYRWGSGSPPFSGASEARLGGWCRHRTRPASVPEAVLGLMDSWPAPVLSLLDAPAPASTVSWTTHFVALPDEVPEDYWWYEGRSDDAGAGYASMSARLFSPDGTLVAHARQLVAVFA